MKSKDLYRTEPHRLISSNYNYVAEINPKPGDERIKVEMVLRASKPVRLHIVSRDDRSGSFAEGPPKDGYEVHGLNERRGWQKDQNTQLVVEDLLPNEKRTVYVFHRDSGLGGAAIVDENVKQPVEIKLTMTGRLMGRLADENGDPITDGILSRYGAVWASDPELRASPTQIPVDEQGRFELNGLIPGWKYSARVFAPRKNQGRLRKAYIGMAFSDVEVKPGESRDLGDLRVVYRSRKSEETASKTNEDEEKPDAKASPNRSS